MRLRVLLICLFFLSGTLNIALADSTIEVRKKAGIFAYEDFQHWLTLDYRFNDHKSGNGYDNNSSHAFQESYNASLKAAIYDPNIFDFNLKAGIVYNQTQSKNETSNTSENDAKYNYNLSGVGLEKSQTPFTLRSYRDIDMVDTTYSAPYSANSSGNEFGISLRNTILPSQFYYARNTLDTSGGGYDSSTVTNSYAYSISHSYGSLSNTKLGINFSDVSGRGGAGAGYGSTTNSARLDNALSMGQAKYTLRTSFLILNSRTDNVPQNNLDFSENFQARLGAALSLGVNYSFDKTRTNDYSGQPQENTKNNADAILKHSLFKSLETSLRGSVSSNAVTNGTENRYGGSAGIKYTKLLPKTSQLTVGITKDYELVNSRYGSANITVTDELHPDVHKFDAIDLPLAGGVLRQVVSVRSRNPLFTYVENVDYAVNYALGRIDILGGAGARIDMAETGMPLYISYVIYKDPLISYSNDSLTVTSALGLLGNRYQVGASYAEHQVTLISGPVNNSLRGSRSSMLYFNGNHEIFNYRISYQNNVVGDLASRAIEGFGRAGLNFYQSSVSLMARERYVVYDATPTHAGYPENLAELTATYARSIWTDARLSLVANALDSQSDVLGNKESMALKVLFSILLNNTTINLAGQTSWILFNDVTTRDYYFNVNVTRNF